MADEDSQEKTEEPSERRLEDARKKGQVLRSKELNTMCLLFGSVLAIYSLTNYMTTNIKGIAIKGFSLNRAYAFDLQLPLKQLTALIIQGIYLILPFLAITFLVALASPGLLGGWSFSPDSISLKWERLDPLSGIKKMFSWKSCIELVKALLKFIVVVLFAGIVFYQKLATVFSLDKAATNVAINGSLEVLLFAGFMLCFALVIIAGIDVPFQMWDFNRQLKMTKQEVRDEAKDNEGKPEIKRKIREKQRELRRRRMMSKVPAANVIITNPTHFAIAVQYNDNMQAPIVVAKGVDLIAELIKKVAKSHNIPFVEAPPLARSLYYHVDLDEAIPAGLYVAVAKILAYVYELKMYHDGDGNEPVLPRDFSIPKELTK